MITIASQGHHQPWLFEIEMFLFSFTVTLDLKKKKNGDVSMPMKDTTYNYVFMISETNSAWICILSVSTDWYSEYPKFSFS